MPGSVNLSAYSDVKDKYGVKVSDWAKQISPGHFSCRFCVPEKTLSFAKGKGSLTQHSESEKHRKQFSASSNNNQKQPSLKDIVNSQKEDDSKSKARDLENAIVLMLSRHSIQFEFVECLVTVLKKYVPDSEIVKNVKLGATKASYLVNYGLGDHYEKETVSLLKNCNSFSAALDESEVNKASELQVIVNVASKDDTRDSRHFACIDIDRGDSETIVNALLDSFVSQAVNFKDKCIDVQTDGCPTMIGNKKGVQTRLKDEIPQLNNTGACNAHHISNTLQHAVEEFDPDIKLACVNVYQDLGGAKGMGLKRKKEFEADCEAIGHEPHPFKKFVNVRFRTIRSCHEPILYNFDAMVHYYSQVKSPTGRQKLLKTYFVEKKDMTHLNMLFIYAASQDLTEAIDFFEKRKVNIHNAVAKLENILTNQMRKILDETELTTLKGETVEKKSRHELVNLDVDNANILGVKKMFVGSDTEQFIKQLGLTPTSKQLTWFFEKVKKFHIRAVKQLQKYFATALQSSVMSNLAGLDPLKQSHVLTKRKLCSLANSYSKVVDNIEIHSMDKLKKEIEEYIKDEDVKMLDKQVGFEEYWKNVGSILDGGWKRFEILPSFANAMGVILCSNSEVERWFSVMNNIHQNKQRNCLSQNSLNSMLHIRSGVESNKIRDNCEQCSLDTDKGHCHCSLVDLTGEIRESCKKAASKYLASLDDARKEKQAASEEMLRRKETFMKAEEARIVKMKESLARRGYFYKPELMESVFQEKKRKVSLEKEPPTRLRMETVNNNKPSSSKKSK